MRAKRGGGWENPLAPNHGMSWTEAASFSSPRHLNSSLASLTITRSPLSVESGANGSRRTVAPRVPVAALQQQIPPVSPHPSGTSPGTRSALLHCRPVGICHITHKGVCTDIAEQERRVYRVDIRAPADRRSAPNLVLQSKTSPAYLSPCLSA